MKVLTIPSFSFSFFNIYGYLKVCYLMVPFSLYFILPLFLPFLPFLPLRLSIRLVVRLVVRPPFFPPRKSEKISNLRQGNHEEVRHLVVK